MKYYFRFYFLIISIVKKVIKTTIEFKSHGKCTFYLKISMNFAM